MTTLTFNPDGTIDPEQLAGMPPELVDRVTSPEFQRQARREIRIRMGMKTGRREMRSQQMGRMRVAPSRFGPLHKPRCGTVIGEESDGAA